ncbi:cathepsin S-like [Histomonas meleagridis]|uniref:cathepsin S-like n=1 Tax=Histomonas meleagridis TaxID=135588 RepID=UPI0035594008|nr:cathepsin S-like [Histomonas meleagridis]KAH0802163.1 cathepsin S-like [Histomonas meleagridis]
MILERSILSRLALFSAIAGVNKDYLSIIKDQGEYGTCWAYSTVSSVEMQYASISGNRMKFSPWDTIVNTIIDYFDGKSQYPSCQQFSTNYFYSHYCAFEYLVNDKRHMIMEYNKKPSSIYVKSYNVFSGANANIDTIVELLKTGRPIVSVMRSATLQKLSDLSIIDKYYMDNETMSSIDHAVTVTGIGTIEGHDGIYLEVLNSWGESIGAEGLNYIKVADSINGTLNRNFNILYYGIVFELGDDEPVQSSNTGLIIAVVVLAVLLAVSIAIIVAIIVKNKKAEGFKHPELIQ